MARVLVLLAALALAVLLGCVVWRTWLRRPPRREIEMRVTDARGAPVERYGVTIRNGNADARSLFDILRPRMVSVSWGGGEGSHPDGISSVLLDYDRVAVDVRASGHAPVSVGPFAVEAFPDRLDVTLPDVGFVTGVVAHDGRNIAGANVELVQAQDDIVAGVHAGGFEGHWYLRAVTDADGRFRIGSEDTAAAYTVSACAAGFAQSFAGPVHVGSPPITVELVEGGAIDGILRLPAGRPVEGSEIEIYRSMATYGWDESVCGSSVAKSDALGAFHLEHVAAGDWLLRGPALGSGRDVSHSAGERVPFVVRVAEGRRTRIDMDLARPLVELDAHWTFDGRPWDRVMARLYSVGATSSLLDQAIADKAGHVSLRARTAGRYLILVTGNHLHGDEPRSIRGEFDLPAEGLQWDHAFVWHPSDPLDVVLRPDELPARR